jgi:hypothetical protein
MVAGKNEADFKDFFTGVFGDLLNGKLRYVDRASTVEISVDNSIMSEEGTLLIEIDSANEAKLIVGQYVLLNQLYDGNKEDTIFLLIHYYPNYNPERSVKNLKLINDRLYNGNGIKFCVFNENSFKDFCCTYNTIDSFLTNISLVANEQSL